ncbi:JmjC domain-containing protein 8 (Jumonji domain-containing protein 8) [Durusdinium trenchii]|uniref:JmjC domain-containing protein 8 (Jumonji domain-containing protein 8) n=1 Tax=Durusdinium trenchii TaxID=1381693 RepID=A0ABP0NBI5_9DINO
MEKQRRSTAVGRLLVLSAVATCTFEATFTEGLRSASRFRLSASRRSLSSLSASQGLEFAQELVGDNERQLLSEFRRCYRENPYPEKLNLFFPNEERIISLLYASTSSYTSSSFLSTVDRIFRQLHAWPSAWPLCRKLLSPEHPWSEAYSKQIIAEGFWSPFDFFTVDLSTLRPLQRYPLEELRQQSSTGFRVVERWLKKLEEEGETDEKLQGFLKKFLEQDKINSKEQVMRLRPLEDLLEYLLSTLVDRIFEISDSDAMTAIVTARDLRQRTILHVAAEQGNSILAEQFLQSVAEENRKDFATAKDAGGYSAGDLALLAGYTSTAEKIQSLGGAETTPPAALKFFPAAEGHPKRSDDGGWNEEPGVPPTVEWLKEYSKTSKTSTSQSSSLCEIDAISVDQFDWTVFQTHYVAPRRPLLIKGGVKMSVSDRVKFTRDGLLQIAGTRPVRAFSTPYEDDFRNVPAVEMPLQDYVNFLDQRDQESDFERSEKLSYIFERLKDDEGPLSFARSPPKLFKEHIKLRAAQFSLGGQLMGSPLHYHVDAVNSLIYGRKLWFLKPPAEQEFRKTVVYEDLAKSGGPQGLRVIQEGGDLLYVPQDWAHGLKQCIGLAHEFDVVFRDAGPVSVETVNAGLGVALAGIAFFSFGIITWFVQHV